MLQLPLFLLLLLYRFLSPAPSVSLSLSLCVCLCVCVCVCVSAQYFASTMMIVGLSVVVTVMVLQFHHYDPQGGKMPKVVGLTATVQRTPIPHPQTTPRSLTLRPHTNTPTPHPQTTQPQPDPSPPNHTPTHLCASVGARGPTSHR